MSDKAITTGNVTNTTFLLQILGLVYILKDIFDSFELILLISITTSNNLGVFRNYSIDYIITNAPNQIVVKNFDPDVSDHLCQFSEWTLPDVSKN